MFIYGTNIKSDKSKRMFQKPQHRVMINEVNTWSVCVALFKHSRPWWRRTGHQHGTHTPLLWHL